MKKIEWPWPRAIVLLVAGILGGCYPKAGPAPGAVSPEGVARASARWPGVSAESLGSGRELFIANCNKCHDYPELSVIADDKWPAIVERMGNKAQLEPAQRDLVLHFILATRAEQVAKP